MNLTDTRILVVDDEPDICQNLADILSDLGCCVDLANDGLSALEFVRRNHYDVALLDLRMPGMDGLTLCRAIKEIRSETVSILVTAFASPNASVEAIDSGAWEILSKPVDLFKLLSLVDKAIAQPLILIVDDDRELCANLYDLLLERGYRVAMAHNGDEAADRLGKASFRVVLIDIKLADSSGDQVFERVREENPPARTVLIAGHREETDSMVRKIVEAGADDVCYKPFDMSQLIQVIGKLAEIHLPPFKTEEVGA